MRDYKKYAQDLRRIAQFQNCFECYEGERTEGSCSSYCTLNKAADAIEELLDELTTIRKQLPRWFSVEDELPHYLDHVLCVNKYGIQMVGYLTDYKEGGFRCESGMDSCDYITHWMPLPKAPEPSRR